MKTKLLEQITSGELGKKELETLRANAERKGGHQDIVDACTAQLAKTRVSSPKAGPDHTPAEVRKGYSIMLSGMNSKGEVARPVLVPLAEALSGCPGVDAVAILKTQIRFYYRGHHMVAGKTEKEGYWLGVLNENKLKDSTPQAWKAIGEIDSGGYFSTRYVNVSFKKLDELPHVLATVEFIN